MTSAQVVETSVIVNNNSSFQNYTNPDDHTQQTSSNNGCNGEAMFFEEIFTTNPTQLTPSTIHMTLKMTSAQVVETSVIVNNNSSFQNYTNPDDHTQQTSSKNGCNGEAMFFEEIFQPLPKR